MWLLEIHMPEQAKPKGPSNSYLAKRLKRLLNETG